LGYYAQRKIQHLCAPDWTPILQVVVDEIAGFCFACLQEMATTPDIAKRWLNIESKVSRSCSTLV